MENEKPIDANVVHDTATAFKKAIESLGAKNVAVIYTWQQGEKTFSGADYDNFLLILGLAEWARYRGVTGKDDDIEFP